MSPPPTLAVPQGHCEEPGGDKAIGGQQAFLENQSPKQSSPLLRSLSSRSCLPFCSRTGQSGTRASSSVKAALPEGPASALSGGQGPQPASQPSQGCSHLYLSLSQVPSWMTMGGYA